jgi:phosphoribosylformylglycinamidine synthase
MELELINPEHKVHGKMLHNDSQKHSIFTSVTVQENNSVMLSTAGSTLGVWVSHGKESSIYLSQRKIILLFLNMLQ